MKTAIETRELFVLDGQDVVVRGTYHKACARPAESGAVGIVFVSSLSPTRAANGDSSVYWADAFAGHGYPSFRIDLPGFGDSDGDPAADLLNYINTGGYAAITAAKVRELVERFDLSGVVLVGLCAGAVTALHTAAEFRESRECRGVVLMDPYFNLPIVSRLKTKIWQKLTGRISRTAFGRQIARMYEGAHSVLVRLLGDALPENANLALLSRWKELAVAGTPILLFKAPDSTVQQTEFDYLTYILGLGGRKDRVAVKVIKGAGHTFSNRVGRAAVREQTEHWLDSTVPLLGRGAAEANALWTGASERRNYATRPKGMHTRNECAHP